MIAALFAVDEHDGLGFQNGLPWPHNKEDMKWFKTLTVDNVVVMGHNTWNSRGMLKPLPNRINVVVSHHKVDFPNIVTIHDNIPFQLTYLHQQYPDKDIFVIGGKQILSQALPVITNLFITRIKGEYDSDVFLDTKSFTTGFKLLKTTEHTTCQIEKYFK